MGSVPNARRRCNEAGIVGTSLPVYTAVNWRPFRLCMPPFHQLVFAHNKSKSSQEHVLYFFGTTGSVSLSLVHNCFLSRKPFTHVRCCPATYATVHMFYKFSVCAFLRRWRVRIPRPLEKESAVEGREIRRMAAAAVAELPFALLTNRSIRALLRTRGGSETC